MSQSAAQRQNAQVQEGTSSQQLMEKHLERTNISSITQNFSLYDEQVEKQLWSRLFVGLRPLRNLISVYFLAVNTTLSKVWSMWPFTFAPLHLWRKQSTTFIWQMCLMSTLQIQINHRKCNEQIKMCCFIRVWYNMILSILKLILLN